MSGFKTQGKRNRELAKQKKRAAKDEKRALRKAERAAATVGVVSPATIVAAPQPAVRLAALQPAAKRYTPTPPTAAVDKPLTLAEVVERWKTTKIVKAKRR